MFTKAFTQVLSYLFLVFFKVCGRVFVVYHVFSLRPGRTLHCINDAIPLQTAGPNPGQKPGQQLGQQHGQFVREVCSQICPNTV